MKKMPWIHNIPFQPLNKSFGILRIQAPSSDLQVYLTSAGTQDVGLPIKSSIIQTVRVNLVHLNDCLGIIEKIITHQVWDEVFNACANEHPSRKDFYSRASRALGSPPPQINEQKTSIKIIDNQWIKKKLDFSFYVSLNDFEKYV